MPNTQEILTRKIVSQECLDANKNTLEIIDYYSKIADIIDRTRTAMGKKAVLQVSTASTATEKLKTNVYASTH